MTDEREPGRERDDDEAIVRPTWVWEGSLPPPIPPVPLAAPMGIASAGFSEIVRAVAMGGDARRATVRLELGGGALGRDKGALVVHGDGDEVAIDLAFGAGAPPVDVDRLVRRVAERLERKGVRVRAFDVR